MAVIIYYFPLRGRAEVMKLICAAKDIPFEVKDVDFANMKADRKAWPFGQAPRLVDGDIDICQSNTIIRYLARKGGLNGANEKEATAVDMIMEAVESLRVKYGALIYQDQLADAAKAAYYTAHIDPSSQEGRNGGAHFGYLDTLLKASGSGFMVALACQQQTCVCLTLWTCMCASSQNRWLRITLSWLDFTPASLSCLG